MNISAERLVDALFKQLKQLFPAAEQTNLKTAQQETDAKRQWIAAFAEGGIRTREQVSAGMRHARASESPFWPSPGQFIKWCKDSKMVLGVSIEDVMGSFTATPGEKPTAWRTRTIPVAPPCHVLDCVRYQARDVPASVK